MLHINQEEEHISNEELYTMLNEKELIKEVQKRQFRKLCHFLRKPSESLVNKYALYVPTHSHRKPGRPKTTYQEYIAKTICPQLPLTENEIRQSAADRTNWKIITEAAL